MTIDYRIIATLLAFVAIAPGARAQSAVKVGQRVRLHYYYAADKSCASLGPIRISMIQDPQHGRLQIVEGKEYARFPPANPRNICNGMQLPATSVFYTASSDFKGIDRLAYDVLFPFGKVKRETILVSVY